MWQIFLGISFRNCPGEGVHMLILKTSARAILPAIAFSILLMIFMAGSASADDPYLDRLVISTENYSISGPENDVLVAFDSGDSRNPYVNGLLWNNDETPPSTK